MPHKLVKNLIILFLAAYFLVGIFSRFLSRGAEDFYPFFSWFLFAEVPPKIQTDFEVFVRKAGEQEFSPPLSIAEAKILDPSRSLNDYYNTIRSLARNIVLGRNSEIEQFRKNLEGGFTVQPVVYEVAEVTYNNIEKFKNGSILKSKPLAVFNSQE